MSALRLFLILLVLMTCAASPLVAADPYVPEDLQPWQQWVLHDDPQQACTLLWNSRDQHRCQWPGSLTLTANERGAGFDQYWELEQPGWVQLPGDSRFWPQQVTVNGTTATVLRRPDTVNATEDSTAENQQRPALWLEAGRYEVSGRFTWSSLPETLKVPQGTALLKLTRNGQFIHQPQMDSNGLLWLNKGDQSAEAVQDNVSFRIFRHVADTIPLVLTTRIQLHVSGQAREMRTGVMLPQGFIPLALTSPLPARLENDGTLRIQLKPGNWTLQLAARYQGPIDVLSPPTPDGPWADQEIWAVEAHPELRVISIEGATAIDPAQTGMPGQWRNLPSYLMTPDTQLTLVPRKRGESDPASERLQLQRTLWLDFDGGGYTVKDFVSGELKSRSRLDATPVLQLGRVSSHGEDQFITHVDGAAGPGVELRQGQVALEAESRMQPTELGSLPAVGWQFNPERLTTRLNLPPGWRLIEATGVDSASSTWLQRWTLLDIFIVLILTLSFGRLWGFTAGAVALLGLVLVYHEPQAPRLIWLHVLIPIALLRVLPAGRFQQLTRWYRNLALLGLLIMVLVFSVQQIRSALYPQLTPHRGVARPYQAEPLMSVATDEVMMEKRAGAPVMISRQSLGKSLSNYRPDLKIQTGPGLPKWQWQQVELRWNGPVMADQTLHLFLLPPLATRLLLVAGVVMIALMFLNLFSQGPLPRWKSDANGKNHDEGATTTPLLTALLAAGLLTMLLGVGPTTAQGAQGAFPPPELLDELYARLTEPAACAPYCTALDQLDIQADAQRLKLEMTYHSQVASAVPLPFPLQQLSVQTVQLDGKSRIPLYRDQRQQLWARVPAGKHVITLHAPLPDSLQRVQLPVPMAAGMVHLTTPGWRIGGISNGQASHGPIELTRLSGGEEKKLQPGELPAFVRVERELVLDLDWQVHTTVTRLSQKGAAAVLEVPLLNGERVTGRDITVKDNVAIINLPADIEQVRWQSSLEKSSQLELVAADSSQFNEIWRVNADRMWHVIGDGIPVIHRFQSGRWLPQWAPWAKEHLTLSITRPEGVKGQTVTIDNSRLQIEPGKRSTSARLTINIRSSHGTDHVITLPQDAELDEVTINGKSQPIKQNKQNPRLVTLPLVPGAQSIALHWHQPQGVNGLTRTPQVNLGTPHVESHIVLKLPASRWTLFVGGPVLGPAVLFWGVLLVILVGAVILGRKAPTPLRWWHWLLLCAGLSQASLPALLPVVGWLVLLGLRRDHADKLTTPLRFNLAQTGLVFLSVVALLTILSAIQQGLLGLPEMQIAGNNSTAWDLSWYQDRSLGPVAEAWTVSVPMYVYRVLMLLWALWLASALLRWLNWGWESFNRGGLWQKFPPRQRRKATGPKKTQQASTPAIAPATESAPQHTPPTAEEPDNPIAKAPEEELTFIIESAFPEDEKNKE
nr:hypothetical protein [uncultured Desulfuromonas sp.]